MEYARCCGRAGECVYRDPELGWCVKDDAYKFFDGLSFCPFCGHDLSRPALTLEGFLGGLAGVPPARVCFDVDGVLADDGVPAGADAPLPYSDRQPYPWVAPLLTGLKLAGHTLVYQTARYMGKCDGDQRRAHEEGYWELVRWLQRHGIPYDEVYMGKASAHYYLDDRGCRVESGRGTIDWLRSFAPLLLDRKP